MPERPTNTDVIFQEGRDVLRKNGGIYVLTTYVEGGNIFSDQLEVDYGFAGQNRWLQAVRYQVGETFLARVDLHSDTRGCTVDTKYLPAQHYPYSFTVIRNRFFASDRCLDGRDAYYYYPVSSDSENHLRGISMVLPQYGLNLGTVSGSIDCFTGRNVIYYREYGRYGGSVEVQVTLDKLLAGSPTSFTQEIPLGRARTLTEQLEISTIPQGENHRKFTVSRQAGQQGAVMAINIPLSLDTITAPPDFSDPKLVYQKMQAIRALLLQLKPVVT